MQAILPELVLSSIRAQIAGPESAPGPGLPSSGNHLGDLTGLEVDDLVGRELCLSPCGIGQRPRLALNNRITLNPSEFGDPTGQIWANGQRFNVVIAHNVLLLPARAINLAAA